MRRTRGRINGVWGILTREHLQCSQQRVCHRIVNIPIDENRLEKRERVWALLQQGAVMYVCGDASRMEPDVRSAIIGIAVACGGMNEAAGRQYVEGLATDRRYLVDVWASN